jgi:hypothetical protein
MRYIPPTIIDLVLAFSGVVDYYITRSPKSLDDPSDNQEIIMNTTLSSKLAALVLALAINGIILSGVAFMFNVEAHEVSSATVVAQVLAGDRLVA